MVKSYQNVPGAQSMSTHLLSHAHVTIKDDEALDRVVALRNGPTISVEARPITSKSVFGEATIIGQEDTRIELTTYENVVLGGVLSPRYFIIGMFDQVRPGNTIWDNPIEGGDIAWAPFGAERKAVYKSRMQVGMLQLTQDRLEELLEHRGVSINPYSFSQSGVVHAPGTSANLGRRTLRELRTALNKSPDLFQSKEAFDSVVDTMLNNFIDITVMATGGAFRARETQADYVSLVKKTRDILSEEPDRVHSVDQICDRLRISRRTLHRAFIDVTQIPPRTYLRNWRLSRARRDIWEYRHTNVTEVAFRWGFFDVGRFAGYYKALFDELPSETLARR